MSEDEALDFLNDELLAAFPSIRDWFKAMPDAERVNTRRIWIAVLLSVELYEAHVVLWQMLNGECQSPIGYAKESFPTLLLTQVKANRLPKLSRERQRALRSEIGFFTDRVAFSSMCDVFDALKLNHRKYNEGEITLQQLEQLNESLLNGGGNV